MATISVIIPVYNDPSGIETTLQSVCEQTDSDYEVIPVDNNSNDTTQDIIETFEQEFPDVVNKQEETEIQSSYAARNKGIQHATGDILVFIDSDMWVDSTWIYDVRQSLQNTDCDYLGWDIELVAETDDKTKSSLVFYEETVSFSVRKYLEKNNFTPTCGLAVRKCVIEAVGDFDERLISGGDKEFGHRVHRAGFEQCYTDKITSYHPVRKTWSEKKNQAIRIGRGHTQLYLSHPEMNVVHPLHPFQYLPPNPFQVRNQQHTNCSIFFFVKLYLIAWMLKLIESFGSLSQYAHQKTK